MKKYKVLKEIKGYKVNSVVQFSSDFWAEYYLSKGYIKQVQKKAKKGNK